MRRRSHGSATLWLCLVFLVLLFDGYSSVYVTPEHAAAGQNETTFLNIGEDGDIIKLGPVAQLFAAGPTLHSLHAVGFNDSLTVDGTLRNYLAGDIVQLLDMFDARVSALEAEVAVVNVSIVLLNESCSQWTEDDSELYLQELSQQSGLPRSAFGTVNVTCGSVYLNFAVSLPAVHFISVSEYGGGIRDLSDTPYSRLLGTIRSTSVPKIGKPGVVSSLKTLMVGSSGAVDTERYTAVTSQVCRSNECMTDEGPANSCTPDSSPAGYTCYCEPSELWVLVDEGQPTCVQLLGVSENCLRVGLDGNCAECAFSLPPSGLTCG